MNSSKFIALNFKSAWLRNLLLMSSIVIAYVLFGILSAFQQTYGATSSDDDTSRMITANKINFTQPLPLSHFHEVQKIPAVREQTYAAWFGGYYQEPRNSLHAIAVDPQSYLKVYGKDLHLSDSARKSFLDDRSAILVGKSMAEQYGWHVGDQISILNKRITRADGAHNWVFRIAGIFEGATEQIDTSFLYIHYRRLNEARDQNVDTIGWIVTKPEDGESPSAMGQAIDQHFKSFTDRTTTESERSFSQAFVAQFGDLALVTLLVLAATLMSLIMIVGSTTALSVQQRAREVGILKALGFTRQQVLQLIVTESFSLTIISGCFGLAIAAGFLESMAESFASIAPGIAITAEIFVVGVLSMIALASLASVIPALKVVNIDTATLLRRS